MNSEDYATISYLKSMQKEIEILIVLQLNIMVDEDIT